jgi:Uma2 family endonuclease
MSSSILTSDLADVEYPESDGLPMADGTLQAFWMTFLFGGFPPMHRDRPNIFVALSLFGYSTDGAPKNRAAPDVTIALGRPKGCRGSCQQRREDDIAPQFVFEVLSPGNTLGELRESRALDDQYDAQEYYILDPDDRTRTIYTRQDGHPVKQLLGDTWRSPLLDVQFDTSDHDFRVLGSDGKPFHSIEKRTEENIELTAGGNRLLAEHNRLLEQPRAAGIEPKP